MTATKDDIDEYVFEIVSEGMFISCPVDKKGPCGVNNKFTLKSFPKKLVTQWYNHRIKHMTEFRLRLDNACSNCESCFKVKESCSNDGNIYLHMSEAHDISDKPSDFIMTLHDDENAYVRFKII